MLELTRARMDVSWLPARMCSGARQIGVRFSGTRQSGARCSGANEATFVGLS